MFRRAYDRSMFEGEMWGHRAHRTNPRDFFRFPYWERDEIIRKMMEEGLTPREISKRTMIPLPAIVRFISEEAGPLEGSDLEDVFLDLSAMGFEEPAIREIADVSPEDFKRIRQRLWKREKDLLKKRPGETFTSEFSNRMQLARAGYDEAAARKMLDDILGAFVMGDARTQWHVSRELGTDPEHVEMMITHAMSDEQLATINDHRASRGLGPIERFPYAPSRFHPLDESPNETSLDDVERIGAQRLRGVSPPSIHEDSGFKSSTQTTDYLKRYMFRHPASAMQTGHYLPSLWERVRSMGRAVSKGESREDVQRRMGLSDWDAATGFRYYLESMSPKSREEEVERAREGARGGARFLRQYQPRSSR